MSLTGPRFPEADLPTRVIGEFREAMLGTGRKVDLAPKLLIEIATRADLREAFIYKFKTEINNPELKSIIIDYIEDLAEALEGTNDDTEAYVELIDRAGLPVATTAVLSGIGLIISMGLALGPAAILFGGVGGLAISGTGRTALRLKINRCKADIKKLRKLASKLRSL